jgi:Holliday junction resolvasome RuvABC endonuclease subunit
LYRGCFHTGTAHAAGSQLANVQQVVGYFFGSSKGSADKADALAAAVRGVGQR